MFRKVILYFALVVLFLIQKPLFMLYHWDIYSSYSFFEWLLVMWHGLPHDLTVAGYFSIIPLLVSFTEVWAPGSWQLAVQKWYLRILLVFILLVFLVDLELYTAWGFRLDATPLIYLTDNPITAIENSPTWALIVFPIVQCVLWFPLQYVLCKILTCKLPSWLVAKGSSYSLGSRLKQTGLLLLVGGVLFVVIRGGVTVSTMNVGRVYFSSDMKLNHAAINPIFSFLSSLHRPNDFDSQYRFMSDGEATQAMHELDNLPRTQLQMIDSILSVCYDASEKSRLLSVRHELEQQLNGLANDRLLSEERPNIILVVLESFSGGACVPLYPDANPQIMPNVNRFYKEGIGFTNMYANSFRTDRGLAAILASYPGQPTNSIMKESQKTQHLQYLSRRLKDYGYDLEFVHGGDADFTNLRSFLMAGGIDHITADKEFPISQRLSKWGVPDGIVLDYLYHDIVKQSVEQMAARKKGETKGKAAPFFKVCLTLSSHEPFDVPFHRFDDPYQNSVAYTDSCLGAFVDRLKQSGYWDNTLIIGVPDHCFGAFPKGVMQHELIRYHIPHFWMGGAIAKPQHVNVCGSQIDIAATLLGQLGMHHEDFNFSKDLMNGKVPHYAFYAWPDGFGFVTDSVRYIQDNANDSHPLADSNDPHGRAEHWGKAYLQKLYDDLSRR